MFLPPWDQMSAQKSPESMHVFSNEILFEGQRKESLMEVCAIFDKITFKSFSYFCLDTKVCKKSRLRINPGRVLLRRGLN